MRAACALRGAGTAAAGKPPHISTAPNRHPLLLLCSWRSYSSRPWLKELQKAVPELAKGEEEACASQPSRSQLRRCWP